MTDTVRNRWLAIVVATLIWALAFWFGLLALSTQKATAFVIMAIGLVFAMYGLAAFERAADTMDLAFRAALVALGVGILALVGSLMFDDARYAVAAVVLAPGLGGAACLTPAHERVRLGIRSVAIGVLALIGLALYATDATVFGLLAPLYVLPLLGVTDGYIDRVLSLATSDP